MQIIKNYILCVIYNTGTFFFTNWNLRYWVCEIQQFWYIFQC